MWNITQREKQQGFLNVKLNTKLEVYRHNYTVTLQKYGIVHCKCESKK